MIEEMFLILTITINLLQNDGCGRDHERWMMIIEDGFCSY